MSFLHAPQQALLDLDRISAHAAQLALKPESKQDPELSRKSANPQATKKQCRKGGEKHYQTNARVRQKKTLSEHNGTAHTA